MFNDWIYVERATSAVTGHPDEVREDVERRIAEHVQTRLRARIDPGIAGRQGRTIRSMAKGGRIVIDDDDELAPVSAGEQLEGLFTLGSGVPSVRRDGNGRERLVFREIDENDLFGSQAWQDDVVDQTVGDVVRQEFVGAFEEAIEKVNLDHSEDRVR